jgi:hypothetical protein
MSERPDPQNAATKLLVLASLIATSGCHDAAREIDAPPPTTRSGGDTLSALPPSLVDVPVSYDLAPVIAALEKAVPRTFGNLSVRNEVPGKSRMHYAFEAQRERFQVRFDGRVARISTVVHYRGKGWFNPPIGPEVGGSCGLGAQRPRLRVELLTTIELQPDWRLRGRSRVARVEAFSNAGRDQCKVTFIKLNMTEKVESAARSVMVQKLPFMNERIAAVDVRRHFEQWWQVLQKPVGLTPGVWLAIQPSSVRIGRVEGSGTTLLATVGLSANPRIVTGARPQYDSIPLPTASPPAVATGMHILMEGILAYPMASALLTQETAGKKISAGGQNLILKRVSVSGIGGGKLALMIQFTGDVSGRIYFVGTPQYDVRTDQLTVPDLDFDVATANVLASGYEWIQHSDLRDMFRLRARWPVGGLLTKAREALASGMNRELAPGVQLVATIDTVQALAVQATRDALVVRAHANGTARLDIKQRQ